MSVVLVVLCQGLDAALHDVDQVFEDCSQYGKIKSIMHAGETGRVSVLIGVLVVVEEGLSIYG